MFQLLCSCQARNRMCMLLRTGRRWFDRLVLGIRCWSSRYSHNLHRNSTDQLFQEWISIKSSFDWIQLNTGSSRAAITRDVTPRFEHPSVFVCVCRIWVVPCYIERRTKIAVVFAIIITYIFRVWWNTNGFGLPVALIPRAFAITSLTSTRTTQGCPVLLYFQMAKWNRKEAIRHSRGHWLRGPCEPLNRSNKQ